jgi:pimeloyl-ACP methyl ester carboxylesterase
MVLLRWMASFQEVLHRSAGEELACSRDCCCSRGQEPHEHAGAGDDSEDSATGVVAMANRYEHDEDDDAACAADADDVAAAADQDADDAPSAAPPHRRRHPPAAAALAAARRPPPHAWPLLRTRHRPITEDGWSLHLVRVRIDPEALRGAEEAWRAHEAEEREKAAAAAAASGRGKNKAKAAAAAADPPAASTPTLPPVLPPKRGHPILMVPGLASAGEPTFDLPPTASSPSLAEDLARRGWDVWIADLRGNGRADRPLAPALLRPWSAPARWTVDTHLELDAPCVLSHVLRETGAASAHWVGHSMGGMLGCGLLSHPRLARAFAGRVRSLSLVASGCFGAGSWHHRGGAVVRALTRLGGFPAGLAGRGLAAVNRALAGRGGLRAGEGLFFWPPNVEPAVGRALLGGCFSWMPPTLVGHFLASLSDEHGLRKAGSRREELFAAAAAADADADADADAAATAAAAAGSGKEEEEEEEDAGAAAAASAERSENERRFLLYADPTALAATAVPVFALNGDRDLFCPAAGALRTVRLFAGERACRRFVCVGAGRGNAQEHYGHFDVICGRRAPDESWPHLVRWLDEHDGTRPVEAFEAAGIRKPSDADLVGGGGAAAAAGSSGKGGR